MPRRPRDDAPGLHHVWVNATGNWRYYEDDIDRVDWIRRFVDVLDEYSWQGVAFCQMTTHVHGIVNIPDSSLAHGMQQLNLGYSRKFNRRHEREGHFVRKRYGNRRIHDGNDLAGTYAYVVLNPVREGMCEHAEDWRWSSYASAIGLTRDFEFVDPSLVVAELGSAAALRDFVSQRAETGRSGHGPVPGTGTWL